MFDAAQTALTVGVPTLAVLIGILVNNSRFGDLNSRFNDLNSRFNDLNSRINDLRTDLMRQIADTRELLHAEIIRVEQVMDARLKHLEENR